MGSLLYDIDLTEIDPIQTGKKAPDFVLKNHLGKDWSLSEHLGQVVALLFYPKNETVVCTRQLCSVRDNWADYLATKAVVVGVSPGSIEEHREFAENYRLPMPLLADTGREVTKIFSRHPWLPVSWIRAILVIDAKGIIRQKKVMFRGFRPTDYSVITSIHQARTDVYQDKFSEMLKNHRDKIAKTKSKYGID